MEHLREVPSRASGSNSATSVIPAVFSDVVDDCIIALGRRTGGEEPPDFPKARNLLRPHLLALSVVQIVKEVVLVEVVLQLFDYAVVHQESINANPVVDAVVLDDALAGKNGGLACDDVIAPVERAGRSANSNSGGVIGHPDQ